MRPCHLLLSCPEPLTPLAFRNAAELRAGRDLDHHVELIIKGLQQFQPSTHISSTTADFSNTTTDQLTGKLRFIRDKSLGGSLFAFSIELDGHPLGELHPDEILEYSVSTGLHQLKVGHRIRCKHENHHNNRTNARMGCQP